MHDLDVVDVYAALTYYYEHTEEIEMTREHRYDREETARGAGASMIRELVDNYGEQESKGEEST